VVAYPTENEYPLSQKFTEKGGVIPEKPSDFKTLQVEESTMRLKDLRKYIQRNKSYGLDTTTQQVSYHERLALVFTPLIFVLIAIPFGLRPLKQQSVAKSIGFCFVLVFLYLLMFRLIVSVGKGGHIPPILSGWLTNVIFIIIALFFFMKRE
jgi:lipopolysaccharide export system permease protein